MEQQQQQQEQVLSLGEKRVRVKFNPSADKDVDVIKNRCADLINQVNLLPPAQDCNQVDLQEFGRLKSMAMTKIEEAAMLAVKAATYFLPIR
jgi:hypothetical protein